MKKILFMMPLVFGAYSQEMQIDPKSYEHLLENRQVVEVLSMEDFGRKNMPILFAEESKTMSSNTLNKLFETLTVTYEEYKAEQEERQKSLDLERVERAVALYKKEVHDNRIKDLLKFHDEKGTLLPENFVSNTDLVNEYFVKPQENIPNEESKVQYAAFQNTQILMNLFEKLQSELDSLKAENLLMKITQSGAYTLNPNEFWKFVGSYESAPKRDLNGLLLEATNLIKNKSDSQKYKLYFEYVLTKYDDDIPCFLEIINKLMNIDNSEDSLAHYFAEKIVNKTDHKKPVFAKASFMNADIDYANYNHYIQGGNLGLYRINNHLQKDKISLSVCNLDLKGINYCGQIQYWTGSPIYDNKGNYSKFYYFQERYSKILQTQEFKNIYAVMKKFENIIDIKFD